MILFNLKDITNYLTRVRESNEPRIDIFSVSRSDHFRLISVAYEIHARHDLDVPKSTAQVIISDGANLYDYLRLALTMGWNLSGGNRNTECLLVLQTVDHKTYASLATYAQLDARFGTPAEIRYRSTVPVLPYGGYHA